MMCFCNFIGQANHLGSHKRFKICMQFGLSDEWTSLLIIISLKIKIKVMPMQMVCIPFGASSETLKKK